MLMFPEMLQAMIAGMVVAIPAFLIYKKAGLDTAWAALVFLPVFGLLLVFVQLAFQTWPNTKKES
jgi:ABC-type glycerol-3-phosphate transport system permease component